MKTKVHVSILGMALTVASCSSSKTTPSSDQAVVASGPSIVQARAEPQVIELNPNFQPKQPARVVADVKDFKSSVTDVKLQFQKIPLEVPMRNVSGNRWEATLTDEQLQMLAVSGRRVTYDATIIARNEDGRTALGANPVQVVIQAPEISSTG